MKIVFDPIYLRPGCVLLQAAMGGDIPTERFHSLFPVETWLTAKSYLMGLYEVTEEELTRLSRMAKGDEPKVIRKVASCG